MLLRPHPIGSILRVAASDLRSVHGHQPLPNPQRSLQEYCHHKVLQRHHLNQYRCHGRQRSPQSPAFGTWYTSCTRVTPKKACASPTNAMRGIDEHEQPHGSDTRRRRRRPAPPTSGVAKSLNCIVCQACIPGGDPCTAQSTETETEFQYNARNVFYNTEKPSLNEMVVFLN